MEKEPYTKLCSILVRFQKIVKLQIFEFSKSDVMPTNVQNISRWFSFLFFASFMEKKPSIQFLTIFQELMKL